jgi:hypothetical protein
VQACSDVLQEEDARLLEHCTDIALTMDARSSMLTVRARMTMGNGLPEEFRQEACPRRRISGLHGEHIHIVDRLIDLRRENAFDDTKDLADHLVEALRQACGGDSATWNKVRRRVRVFCPDGAHNEQLAGRLAGSAFTEMRFVIRCCAHAIQGCIKKAWACDAKAQKITKAVQDVATFLRSSSRFSLRFSSKAREDILAALSNFSFAPQRFSSKERPLTRIVLFGRSIMLVLGLEVVSPTSKQRKDWALQILRELTSTTWLLIGMLADLSEDCAIFLRHWDERHCDALAFSSRLSKFMDVLKARYQEGGLWLVKDGTYTKQVVDMLKQTALSSFKEGFIALNMPSKGETERCQATISNLVHAIRGCHDAEFPSFGIQRMWGVFELDRDAWRREGQALLPSAKHRANMKRLLHMLGWTTADQQQGLEEY